MKNQTTEEFKQDCKEMNSYFSYLSQHPDKDSGNLWTQLSDKFNAFERKYASQFTPSKPLPLSEDKINELVYKETTKYVYEKHNQDECSGFIDGLKLGLSLQESGSKNSDILEESRNSEKLDCKVSEKEISDAAIVSLFQKHFKRYASDLPEIDKLKITEQNVVKDFRNLFCSPQPKEVKEVSHSNVYEIDFGNHLRARIKVVNNKIEVEAIVNGWGNAVPLDEVKINQLSLSLKEQSEETT